MTEDLEHDGLALDVLDEGPGHLHCDLEGGVVEVGRERHRGERSAPTKDSALQAHIGDPQPG